MCNHQFRDDTLMCGREGVISTVEECVFRVILSLSEHLLYESRQGCLSLGKFLEMCRRETLSFSSEFIF